MAASESPPRTARPAGRRALRAARRDVGGSLFQLVLLFTLVFALAVLVVLLWTSRGRRIPYSPSAGGGFFTSDGVASLAGRRRDEDRA